MLAKLSDEELIQLRKFNIELQIILPFFMYYDFSMTKVDEFLAGLKAWNLISLQKKLVQEKESYWKINTHSWKLMQKTNYDSNQLGDKGIYYLVCWKILVYKYSNIFSSKFRYKCGVQMCLLMPNIQKFIVHLLNNNVMKMEDTWESIDLHLKEQIIGLFPEKNQKIAKQAFYCAKKIYIKLYPDDDKYYWKHFGTILCFIVISKQILIKNKARKKVSLDSLLKHMAHDNDANLNMKIQLLFEEIKYGLYGIRENLKSKISLKDNMLNYNFICAQSPEEVINNFLMVSRILFNDPLFMMFYGKVQIPIEQVKIRMRI